MSPEAGFDRDVLRLSGAWTLAALQSRLVALEAELRRAGPDTPWDLLAIERLDSAGAALLWRSWGQRWPARLTIGTENRLTLERFSRLPDAPRPPAPQPENPVGLLGRLILRVAHAVHGVIALFGQLMLDVLLLCRHPNEFPWREFSANLYKSGAQALPVAALVGFLIGVALSYLSALQLKMLGADLFIVNILGISIIRELGPVLVAVLVAGRSGSAITAQIGVMRVTEEIDALATMGVSRTLRIVLPKVLALTIAMPLLVLWTSATALVGGMLAALFQLDLSMNYFIDALPRAVPLANLLIGLAKGVVFGFLIALIGCHFGLHVRPNTESLSRHTTSSVVSSITVVILVDALFAVFTRHIGMPGL